MKIRPVEAELFHADRRTGGRTDGQTDTTKLIVAFPNFAILRNASKNFRVQANLQISPVYFRNSIKIREMIIKIQVPASQ